MKEFKRSQVWTSKRLREVIEQEMIKLGVVDFKIIHLINFEALLRRKAAPCAIKITNERNGDMYKLYVFKDAATYVIRIEEIEK